MLFKRFLRQEPTAPGDHRSPAAGGHRSERTPEAPPTVEVAGLDRNMEQATHAIGRHLLDVSEQHRTKALSLKNVQNKLMDWAMQDAGFKVNLFRFIDVFPTLKTPDAIHTVLTQYLDQPGVTLPAGLATGMKAGGMFKGTFAKTMSSQITQMAEQFIAGTDAESAVPLLESLWQKNQAFSLDLLGEACVSEQEALVYQQRYLDLIERLPALSENWPDRPKLTHDHLGAIPRVNVSIKVSSLSSQINPADPELSIECLYKNLEPILRAAEAKGVLINFDMEHHALKDLTLQLFETCCERINFEAGLAMQAYLRSGESDAQRLIDWSKKHNRRVTVRLIKGAYWDFETIHADQMGWPVPVWSRKRDSDACFERMAKRFVDHMPRQQGDAGVCLALGSHNLRSIAATQAMLKEAGLPPEAIEYQMLHGMADELKDALTAEGHRVRVYLPVGEMIPGMAYFVRRLLENTSNESWLRGSQADQIDVDKLLASPHTPPPEGDPAAVDPGIKQHETAALRHRLSDAVQGLDNDQPFVSEPMRDLSDHQQRANYAKAIAEWPVPNVTIQTDAALATKAIDTATKACDSWREIDPMQRSQMLVDAAHKMGAHRDQWSGVVIRESNKTWAEADADVCEAIDFLHFYARQAIALFEPERMGQYIGELDQLTHTPIGVAAVISPWNFPLAIATGLAAAALVTGNPTILKPAEQTSGLTQMLCELLWEVGVPKDVLQHLPGQGETIGQTLVDDPRVNMIAFTGSKQVGFNILKTSGNIGPTRRVVCEMGGKNAIIVDATADLDEAVLGARHSAFGFSGQKCSACSRLIVVGTAYEPFVERFVESAKALTVGDPMFAATDMGPVIDDEAADKIHHYIQVGREEATAALTDQDRGLARESKRHIGPHIFTNVKPDMKIANDEVFGPVVAIIHVDTFEEALQVANATDYKLTGGVFTRTPDHLTMARKQFRVGNLYLNRGNTGALVGRQPFGGFGHSGTGTKAGGRDYLKQFVYPIAISENTMRRGFAPDLTS